MARFSVDADLLGYEPNVFVDLPLAAQRKLRVTDGALSGATLSSASGGFAALAPGQVAVIEVSAAERTSGAIDSVVDDNTLVLAAAPVGLSAATGLVVEVRSFEPQARLVHDELVRAVGIDVEDGGEALSEQSILSVELMRRLEALGTLSRAYAAALAITGDNDQIAARHEMYRRRFARALDGARVLIDADGDGRAELWRTPGVGRLVRA